MGLTRTWLVLLGTISLSLLPLVLADTQLADPNLAVISEFNVVLTDNTKWFDLGCCMSTNADLASIGQYSCVPHKDLQLGQAPGSRRIGIQFCHHRSDGSSPDQVKSIFKSVCEKNTGSWLEPDGSYCPQIWPNYKDGYKKPAPPAAPKADPDPAPPPPPPSNPDLSGKTTNDENGFKTEGTFNYALVDYAITRSMACCKASTKPIVRPAKYKCGQRKVSSQVFLKQCVKILPTITKAKKLAGYTTIGDGNDEIVDDATKQQCSNMWTNALTYTYGFCKLDYDQAQDEATKAFSDDCTAKGGELKDPHNGMCLWEVDDAAGASGFR
ncbi:uncharacterized protein MEPE_02823 [Melanopsichium pennsylvanicum]|uniref:Uncharacterized protein n=2 Tax=Melanopsichium pennsylvanicum TaxID=63383 RepID=A0AAJ4XL17_9BASI|nr:hypothetical protein BN887_03519 [Melanopsichium pennsylvanicum 4]SNX84115.1 uncharacterized protein MEPE_02823 [Melanopsichium pennsylvanicum]